MAGSESEEEKEARNAGTDGDCMACSCPESLSGRRGRADGSIDPFFLSRFGAQEEEEEQIVSSPRFEACVCEAEENEGKGTEATAEPPDPRFCLPFLSLVFFDLFAASS